jgi:hypothetical protein
VNNEMPETEIVPGAGLGRIQFGMTANEVEEILGRADDAVLYDERTDRSLNLKFKGIFFTFYQSDDFRLGSIEAERIYPCRLFGANIASLTLKNVEPLFRTAKIPKEDFNDSTTIREEALEEITYTFHRLGMTLYFDLSESLQSVSWRVRFDAGDNIIWPNSGVGS